MRLDARGLHDVVTQQNVTMCGFGPAVTMLIAARRLGATSAELVKYATSGDVSGDRDRVVGYAGILVQSGLRKTASLDLKAFLPRSSRRNAAEDAEKSKCSPRVWAAMILQ